MKSTGSRKRSRGFERGEAPLMRVALLREGEEQYRMLWTHHHSLLDGWSVPLVYRDVMMTYGKLKQGEAWELVGRELGEVPAYESYMEWLGKRDEEEAKRYWREYLAGVETVTELPYDQRRASGEEKIEHRMEEIGLGRAATAELKALAKKHETTVNTLVQLGWGVMLGRYSGEGVVMYGAVVSGRPAEVTEIETMVGLFINTIPVVMRLEELEETREAAEASRRRKSGEGREIGELIAELHGGFQRSQEYGYLPLTEMQRQWEWRSSGGNGGRGLFDSLLVFENYLLNGVDAADVEATGITIAEVGTSIDDTYPLAMGVFQGEELSVTCNYFGNRFSQEMVKRMLGQWMNVLRQLPAVKRTNQITLLSAEEAEELLAGGQGNKMTYRQGCVHEWIAEQAEKTPEAVAVVLEEQRLSYGELNEKAERLAGYLVEAGVKVESRVGICLGRSLEMMIGVLGVLKAGGAYVPLEPGLPKERVEYMVADAGIEWVLMESETMGRLPLAGVDVIAMDGAASDPDWLEGTGDEELLKSQQEQVKSGNLAYILYTSGTTGRPKGVMVEHGGLTNYVGHAVAQYVTEEIEGAVVSTPLSFDATLTTLLPALTMGKPVELLRDDERMLERLAERLFAGGEGQAEGKTALACSN